MIIAQITDTHIKANGRLAYRRVDSAARLRDCIAHLNGLAQQPDVALVTGDICDFGKPEEYEVAREILDALAMPYHVIPGNHDDCPAFRAAFQDHHYLPDDGFLHYVLEDYPVRLIGLDTTVHGKPYGELCRERLDWLGQRLDEQPDRLTLIFMHHPPFLTGIEHMDVQNCRNGQALGALIERHPQVQRIICGHVHRAIELTWHGCTASIGPSPSHSVALDLDPAGDPAFVLEPPSCQLIHLSSEGYLVGHVSFVGRYDGPHPFFTSDGRLID